MRLEPKVFDVLAYLVRQRERVVAKDELLAQLWPGEFVSETVLPRCITAARKAVGDDPAGQKVIQTVHGRGYRFVASITDDAKRAPSDDSAIESVARLAEEIRQPVYSWFTTWWRGSRALCDGRFDEAERLRQQALAIGQRIQHPGAMAIAHGQSLWLASERGYAFEVFEAGFQFLLDYYPPAAIALRAGEAVYRAEAGDVGEARRCFEALAAHEFADIPRDEHWLVTLTALAQACASLRDTPRAATLYEQLRPFAQRNVVHDLLRTYGGSVSLHLGLLAQAMGKLEAAARHFEDALAMNTRIGGRPCLARTQYEYARMLVARGCAADRRRAAALLDQAMACAEQLGLAEARRNMAAELRRRAAERPPGAARPTSR